MTHGQQLDRGCALDAFTHAFEAFCASGIHRKLGLGSRGGPLNPSGPQRDIALDGKMNQVRTKERYNQRRGCGYSGAVEASRSCAYKTVVSFVSA